MCCLAFEMLLKFETARVLTASEVGSRACSESKCTTQQFRPRAPLAQVLEEHSRPVLSLAVSGTRLFSGSYDYTIRVWDLETMAREATLRGHTDAVRTLAVAGGKLFSGSYDGTVKVGWKEAVVLDFFTGVYR